MDEPYLISSRLELYELGAEHAHHLFDLDSDPEVMKYITDGKRSSPAEIDATITRIQGYFERFNHRFGTWCAFDRATGEFVGWFLLRPDKKDLDNTRDIEVGYRLKQRFWGKGFATEVSRMLVERAFSDGAQTVYATAMAANSASIRIMKKLGMTLAKNYVEDQFPGTDKSAVKYELKNPKR